MNISYCYCYFFNGHKQFLHCHNHTFLYFLLQVLNTRNTSVSCDLQKKLKEKNLNKFNSYIFYNIICIYSIGFIVLLFSIGFNTEYEL